MFRLTKAKLVVFVALATPSFSPLLLFGSGPAVIVPVIRIFWLAGLAGALGVPVAAQGGVDAFNLIPPTGIGSILLLVGSAISLAGHYVLASVLVTIVSNRKHEAGRTGKEQSQIHDQGQPLVPDRHPSIR